MFHTANSHSTRPSGIAVKQSQWTHLSQWLIRNQEGPAWSWPAGAAFGVTIPVPHSTSSTASTVHLRITQPLTLNAVNEVTSLGRWSECLSILPGDPGTLRRGFQIVPRSGIDTGSTDKRTFDSSSDENTLIFDWDGTFSFAVDHLEGQRQPAMEAEPDAYDGDDGPAEVVIDAVNAWLQAEGPTGMNGE